ncbi:MAG TPA: glycosyltransferase family 4 protein [Vicinamibacterales bacterium]|jgi:glycosyltransferase involved in cell wall biosynthesis
MRILLATDSFPPICGGSGWSTYELARGLRARGHEIEIVQPKRGSVRGMSTRHYDGFEIVEPAFDAPDVPYVRNYYKNERLYPALTEILIHRRREGLFDVVHGQHVLTTLPAIDAAKQTGAIAVSTVRDYWPVCYWSDLIHTSEGLSLCPACSAGMMTRCVRPRSGPLWPLALPMIPYMRRNLERKRTGLARADAVIAVSSTIAADLRARAPELARTRLEIIPNPVDVTRLRERAAAAARPVAGPYALYLGKLAPNKGTSHLVDVVERASLDWPLVIVGDGPDAASIAAAAARSSRDIRVIGWVDGDATVAWLTHASLLIFPSRGPESLSRVLIEASALGVPIAAMNTGGTPDIIQHDVTGLLSSTPEGLADDVRRMRGDEALRRRLGEAARQHAERSFDAPSVVERIERLYLDLLRTAR